VKIDFDPAKNERNIGERGIPFTLAVEFDWDTAVVIPSDRHGEERYAAVGFIRGKLYVLVHAKRDQVMRVISLRRANKREILRYEKTQP
jgi:uncharacterized protein